MALSDSIELFICSLLDEEGASSVELQRNELAAYFHCAPSQINYVLATRFTLERGYIIESRRGGGGFIRILRVCPDRDDHLLKLATEIIGNEITQEKAHAAIESLQSAKIVTREEASLMRAAVCDKAIALPIAAKDTIRANLLKAMIIEIMRWERGGEVS